MSVKPPLENHLPVFDLPEAYCPSRRRLLQAMLASGICVALPAGSLLRPLTAQAAVPQAVPFKINDYQIFRNACPRNCYDTCSLMTYVKDGVIQFVEGAPESAFTQGGLCVKGYTYPRQVYEPSRIKYPMVQEKRGSGNWKRISWNEAADRIAKKILEIKDKDGSLLGLALTKYSGNFGITHYGIEGFMSSLGYTSRLIGTPCWPAGIDAQNFDFGDMVCNDPEDLPKAKYVIAWGVNPAWCSVHSMKYLYEAQKNGARLLVIDPVLTQTAAKADEFWQVRTGEDGALALGMARHILDRKLVNQDFVRNHALGFDAFADYLRKNVTVDWAAKRCGIPAADIRRVAEAFAKAKPATIWIGYGMQRHTNGGANVRAIDALVAMTGNIGVPGGGARYAHLMTWGFNYHAMIQSPPTGSKGFRGKSGPKGEFDFAGATAAEYTDRTMNINKTAQEILDATDPPVRMLWSACKNPFAQDFDRAKLLKAFEKLEMVVSVDLFFTETVKYSDIVLPAITPFEEWTVNASYWHYWVGLNEQAIQPMHECKSDNEIHALISKRMNELRPGSCTFPQTADSKEWMEKEFNQGIYDLLGIKHWSDLQKGPAKAKLQNSASWADLKFKTPSGKYEFQSELCEKNGHAALPAYKEGRKPTAPYRLLTPHTKYAIHSQFLNIDWMLHLSSEPFVYLHPKLAKAKAIKDMDLVRLTNALGALTLKAKVTANVPEDSVLVYEAWYPASDFNVQNLVDDESADMGAFKTGAPGVAIHDQFVDIAKVSSGSLS
ncbi:MAG: molybdopterin-dependent oxidoreductase [Burkholderiales bacterium]|jgi:anaerobic selenocysteine-containing dehydrogenase|nr:molybdopterin-dependent oxidoreductase [Burkholderiales bacterium]